MRYLLDTNIVIHYLNATLPVKGMQLLNSIVDDEPMVSVVTKMETLGFNFTVPSEQTAMEIFINGCNVLDLNSDIVNKTIELRKTIKTKLPDAIIAATAITFGLTLITNNAKDFKNINGLTIIDPHSL